MGDEAVWEAELRASLETRSRRELVDAQVRLSKENILLREAHQRLLERIEALEERLGTNSSNSDSSPSSDRPGSHPRKGKKSTGRKKGGQRGHRGSKRIMVPPEEVSRFESVRPYDCTSCGGQRLEPAEVQPHRHQVWELPAYIRCDVTEYQLHTFRCQACAATTQADLPAGVSWSNFGPRLHGFVGMLSGVLGATDRPVQEFLREFLDLEVSLGAVAGIRKRLGRVLEAPHAEALEYARDQAVVYADETTWKQNESLCWLWTAVTSAVTVFLIQRGRSQECARQLFGDHFGGVAVCDRLGSYGWLPNLQRCWAHLLRTFHRIAGRPGSPGRIGQRLEKLGTELLIQWKRVRSGMLARSTFRAKARVIRKELRALLEEGARCGHRKTAGSCKAVLSKESEFWTFARVPGVEPTNNEAERSLRRPVIWRKIRYRTHSSAGSRWTERILTSVETLRKQRRPMLDFLEAAFLAYHGPGRAMPSLLPA